VSASKYSSMIGENAGRLNEPAVVLEKSTAEGVDGAAGGDRSV
jgi:hypothetical protein